MSIYLIVFIIIGIVLVLVQWIIIFTGKEIDAIIVPIYSGVFRAVKFDYRGKTYTVRSINSLSYASVKENEKVRIKAGFIGTIPIGTYIIKAYEKE